MVLLKGEPRKHLLPGGARGREGNPTSEEGGEKTMHFRRTLLLGGKPSRRAGGPRGKRGEKKGRDSSTAPGTLGHDEATTHPGPAARITNREGKKKPAAAGARTGKKEAAVTTQRQTIERQGWGKGQVRRKKIPGSCGGKECVP